MNYGFTCNGKLLTTDYSNILGIQADLPKRTIRVQCKSGYEPYTTPLIECTKTLIDADANIWDVTTAGNSWLNLFNGGDTVLKVLGANSSQITNVDGMFYYCTSLTHVALFDLTGVTSMREMFRYCRSLIELPLFDTSNVTDMYIMCAECNSLKSIPLFNTTNLINAQSMFWNCYNVESGALALYQQMSTQSITPTEHYGTFRNCGRDTQTGAAELAQIPTDWGGTMTIGGGIEIEP